MVDSLFSSFFFFVVTHVVGCILPRFFLFLFVMMIRGSKDTRQGSAPQCMMFRVFC